MKKLICFIAVMMLTVITASAQELSAHITADEQTGAITVSGNGATYGGQLVSILIAEDEGEFYSPDSPLITEAVHSDENGDFSVNITLSESLMGGEYQAEIATANSKFNTSFIVVSLDYAGELFEIAKKCKSKVELKESLQTRPYDMGISPSYWELYSSALTDAIYSGITNCKTTLDFIKLCRSSLAMERILNGEDISGVLKECENSMYVGDATCYDMWNTLNDETKAKVKDNYISGNDPALSFAESCLMSAVESAQSWRELSDVIYPSDENVFADVLDLNTEYFTSKNADQIMRLLYKEINSMDTPEDIRKIFFKVSKNYENKKENSSGGSSGGSAGSASPVVQSPASAGEIIFDYKSSADDTNFTDITGHWGENYITKLSKSGDINGYADGSFRPDNLVTRAEFATMLFNCFDIAASNAAEGFLDVSSSDWFAVGVNACKSAGIVNGDEFNCFNPDMYITREDAAVMLYRLLCRTAELEEVPQIPFNDEALISDYAKSAVGALVDEGVISGFGNGYFRPLENTTRAQAVAMLVKSMDLLNAVS